MKKYFVALKNVTQAVSEMPEVQAVVTVLGGAAALSGWVVADLNRRKINDLESIDRLTENWDTIKVHPGLMDDIRNGETLMYRQKVVAPGRLFAQATTRPDGFSEEANEKFEKGEESYGYA